MSFGGAWRSASRIHVSPRLSVSSSSSSSRSSGHNWRSLYPAVCLYEVRYRTIRGSCLSLGRQFRSRIVPGRPRSFGAFPRQQRPTDSKARLDPSPRHQTLSVGDGITHTRTDIQTGLRPSLSPECKQTPHHPRGCVGRRATRRETPSTNRPALSAGGLRLRLRRTLHSGLCPCVACRTRV